MTYYNPAGGLGKCGNALQDSDYVVSMNPSQYADNLCGAAICVSFNGKTVQGTLQDRCAGCAYGDIDVTPPMFTTVSSLDAGRINMQWSFCNSNPAPPSPSPVKPDPITTTAIQQPVPQQTSIAVPVVTTVAQINPPTTATSAQTTSDAKGASPSSPQPSSGNALNQTTTSTSSSASNPQQHKAHQMKVALLQISLLFLERPSSMAIHCERKTAISKTTMPWKLMAQL
ncbi:hypothetical protein BCR33DRAFT_698843 [Rhizoclosmatium globosum]|uniref:RlpA-like protein double-psi beta-barrel domain-containing protein n=1 Tax=Rhizoclosmatium globosum TaxID=329046 RepID=A0A1Y2C468_9FUNG|nr:hypothetical protein BCR33DRAFT_698843 [Rhizoclosmatium globosum]|eukprot:ORY41843.1 hypothetical protein BCR33DRAFT_698843 [Rhizoclosmatium globosum]